MSASRERWYCGWPPAGAGVLDLEDGAEAVPATLPLKRLGEEDEAQDCPSGWVLYV